MENKDSKTWKQLKGFEVGIRQKAIQDTDIKITKATHTLDCSYGAIMEILHAHQFHYYKALCPEFQSGSIIDSRHDTTTHHIVFQRNGFTKKEFYLLHRVIDTPKYGTIVAEKSIDFIKFPKKRGVTRINVDFNFRVVKFISLFRTQVINCFYIKNKKGVLATNMTNSTAAEMAAEQMDLLERIGTFIDLHHHLPHSHLGDKPRSRSEPILSSAKSRETIERNRSHTEKSRNNHDRRLGDRLERIDPDATRFSDFDIEGPDKEVPRRMKKFRPIKVTLYQQPEQTRPHPSIPAEKDPVYEYPLPPLEEHLQHWDGRYCFGKLCAAEYAEESINCIVGIMEFMRMEDSRLKDKAESIYNCFLREDAPQRVNLTSRVFAAIEARFSAQQIKSDMFDQVKASLIHLLNQNIYIKYRRTQYFELWLRLKGLEPSKMREEWIKRENRNHVAKPQH